MEDDEIIAYKGKTASLKNKLVTGIVDTDGKIEWIENDNSGISILVTPRSQTEGRVESQTVGIKVESQDWVDWEAQYNWNRSKTQNPEEWKSLTLTGDGTLKEGSATISADDSGDYYLWIKITTNGETKTKSFGAYKLGARPKAENIICTMTSTSDNDTKGVITVGSNKVFEEWKLVYRLNSGSYEELEQGKTKTVNVVKNDLVEVKYIKDGETDVIKSVHATEKMSWGGNPGYYYGLVGGIVGKSNDSQISNCENSGSIFGGSKNMENHGIGAGGIVGWATNSDISLSKSKGGSIYYYPSQLTDDGGALGGIAGVLISSTINQCFNTSNISSQISKDEYMQDNFGGIVGYGSAATIKNVYNTGKVYGHNNVGGICGTIDNSVGQNYLYNTFNASENVSGTNQIGNIVGIVNRVTGKYCGYIKDTTQIGNNINSTFSNCTAYTLTQMKTTGSGLLTLLKNGDGSGLWAQSSSKNNGLPYLVNNQP